MRKMSTKRQKSGYRELQAVAKQLQLPGNVKYQILQQMVKARREGNEILVQKMISDNERVKMRRRAEKYEARQAAYNHVKSMMGKVVKQEANRNNEDDMSDVGANTNRVWQNSGNGQSKSGTLMDAYIRSLLLLPQEKRTEMIRRRKELMVTHQGSYGQYSRPQNNFQHQYVACCSSRSIRFAPAPEDQMVASPDQEFREYYTRSQCHQGNDHFRENFMFEPNGNYSAEPLNPNDFVTRAQELVVPLNGSSEQCFVPNEQAYEEQILSEENYDHSSTTTGITQMTGSPDSDTLSSDETRALASCGGGINMPVNQYHQPGVQVEYRNDNRIPYIVEQYCQDYVEDTEDILSDHSDSDALHINSSIESQMDNYSDVGEQISPNTEVKWLQNQGSNEVQNQNGAWPREYLVENPPGNYIEL